MDTDTPGYGWRLVDETISVVDWDDLGNAEAGLERRDTSSGRFGDGVNAIFRPDISTITLGTEEPDPDDPNPDDDDLAMIIVQLGSLVDASGVDARWADCSAAVLSATVSTSDARVGTALDINARKYVSEGDAGRQGTVWIEGIDSGLIVGVVNAWLTEEILSPIEAPRYEGSFAFVAGFTAEVR